MNKYPSKLATIALSFLLMTGTTLGADNSEKPAPSQGSEKKLTALGATTQGTVGLAQMSAVASTLGDSLEAGSDNRIITSGFLTVGMSPEEAREMKSMVETLE